MPRRPDNTNGSRQQRTLDVVLIGRRPIDKKVFKCILKDHDDGITTKELIMKICQEEEMLPNHSALFGICLDEFGQHYIPYTKKINPEKYRKNTLHFRLQFKAVDCTALRKDDKKAFDYYLLQCRHDFVHGHFRKNLTKLEDHNKKQEMLLRMVILEMLLQSQDETHISPKDRTIHLQQIFRRRNNFSVEKILEKYVNERDEVKKCKKIIEKSLQMFKNVKEPEFDFVREIEFLPDYRKETVDKIFKVYGVEDVTSRDDIWITVHPQDGISRVRRIDDKFKKADDKFQFDSIDSLAVKQTEENPIAPRYQLIIVRHEKAPEVLFSDSEATLDCLCSWIDGYYRLLVDQYVSLLELQRKLSTLISHGPIEHSISENFLESFECSEGDFLIREHRRSYGKYVLTMKAKDGFKHYEINCQTEDNMQKYFIQEGNNFESLKDLVKYYQDNTDPTCFTLKRNITPVGRMPYLSERQSVSFLKKPVSSPQRFEVRWIDSKSLIKLEDMGKGRFGEVCLCKQRLDTRVLKVVVRKFETDDISKKAFERIAKYYKEMTNRLIVRLTGSSSAEDNIRLLAFEHMELGPLDEYLVKNKDSIRYRAVLKYMTDIAEGMMYLEKSMRVVHGNLRVRNVLLMDNDNIKISDACFDWVMQQEGRLPKTAIISSCNWRAPEVLRGGNLTHLSDVWSFGVTIWDIMSLSKPMGNIGKDKLLETLSKDVMSPNQLPYCSEELQKILTYCWKEDPTQRIHFEEIFLLLRSYKPEVGTQLLERPYFTWKLIEEKEREKVRMIRRQQTSIIVKGLTSSSASTLSGNSGSSGAQSASDSGIISGSNSYHVIGDNRNTDSSIDAWSSKSSIRSFESTKSIDRLEFVSNVRAGDTAAVPYSDIEMKDLTSNDAYSTDKTSEGSTDFMDTDFRSLKTEPLSNLSELVEDISYKKHEIAPRKHVELVSKSLPLSRSTSEEPSEGDVQVTSDVMEVANVLASMAQHHGSDQKRRNPSKIDAQRQKPPKMMPQLQKAILIQPFTPSQATPAAKTSNYPSIVNQTDKHYDSAYGSADSVSVSAYARDSSSTKVMYRPPECAGTTARPIQESPGYKTIEDIELAFERKKRSHSITEETKKMHKKAAKRALDRPNPFNLGSTVPKNFLIKRKNRSVAYPKNQPVDVSKYFHELMTDKGSGDFQLRQDKERLLPKSQHASVATNADDQGYKSMSDIQLLDQKMSYLKAASPQSASPQPTTPTVSPAAADPNAVHAAISAYLTQLVNQGHSVVAGNPVFIPQIAVNANANQSASLPQLLHLLQAQQKAAQSGGISPQILTPNRQIDPSLQISPTYLQTFLAIMASKNMLASSGNYNQLTQTVPVSTLIQSPGLIQGSNGLISTPTVAATAAPNSQLLQELQNKAIDIKPKVSHNTIDLTGSDRADVYRSETKSANERPQLFQVPQVNPSIPQNILRSLVDSKNQTPRPIFVRSTQAAQSMLIDSNKQPPRPVLLKSTGSPHQVRLQPLLPKGISDQLDQQRDVKLPTSQMMKTQAVTNSGVQNSVSTRPLNKIKIEPSSPSAIDPRTVADFSQGINKAYIPTSSSLGTTRFKQHRLSQDKVRGFSEKLSQVQRRRQSEENSHMIAQLGNVKVFSNDDLTLKEKLGEGQFGEVWKAILRCKGQNGSVTQRPVAVKKLKSNEEQSYEQFKNEVKQLALLDNDYIVKLIGVSIDPKGEAAGPWIITDLMTFGNLNQFIVNHRKTVSEGMLLKFAIQIAEGMEFLQSRSVVHRDLAARNVLVESKDRVKVCDFGLSRMFGENKDYYRGKTPTMLPIRWYALESIRDSVFTSKSDVWSYGVTLWEMFLLWGSELKYANPYGDMNGTEILEFIEKGNRLTKPDRCKDELWALILGCWQEKPDDRPSFYILSYEISNNHKLNLGFQGI